MDTGLQGKQALVCAASKGLGKACAQALAAEGVNLTLVARTPGPLSETAQEIRERYGVEVREVAIDITTPEGVDAAISAFPAIDILVTNAGGPPPGDFRDWDREAWHKAVDANMLTPIELMKRAVDGMIERGFGRIVNITSGAVKAPIAVLGLSNGARSGLTGFVAGLARETVAHNVTINNLLPGPFETDRLEQVFKGEAKRRNISPEEAREQRRNNHPAKRFGQPEEFGSACVFLCSAHSGFITGQNLLLDGGAYPGTF
ncbi:SDR family oxidoreductase [Pokkaliibacter sp. CJK22405]|uniref:SDR family oxidoreductase n=1 Tax=Pokkaliibacter sp. CJK22405 TaxID=3384615 RepID=UPI0039856A6D